MMIFIIEATSSIVAHMCAIRILLFDFDLPGLRDWSETKSSYIRKFSWRLSLSLIQRFAESFVGSTMWTDATGALHLPSRLAFSK